MLHVTQRQLCKAFQRHRQPAVTQAEARGLLLFYSVESGLKAAWLKRNTLRDTSFIETGLKERGHDLMYWTKELRLPASIANHPLKFRLRQGGSYGIEAAHQAWRYGAHIDPAEQVGLETWLEQTWLWAKEELGL